MKLGIMRCQQTEDFCAGGGDFKALKNKAGVYADIQEDIELVAMTSCGGCPGKKTLLKAKLLVSQGADTIAFASCIAKGTPLGFPCPFHDTWKEILAKKLPGIRFLDHTH